MHLPYALILVLLVARWIYDVPIQLTRDIGSETAGSTCVCIASALAVKAGRIMSFHMDLLLAQSSTNGVMVDYDGSAASSQSLNESIS